MTKIIKFPWENTAHGKKPWKSPKASDQKVNSPTHSKYRAHLKQTLSSFKVTSDGLVTPYE
jgi:hypothetical protein